MDIKSENSNSINITYDIFLYYQYILTWKLFFIIYTFIMDNQNNQNIWIDIVKALALRQDAKKLLSFLSKVAITNIEDNKLYISSPNQFVLVQVQKFFGTDLDYICKDMWYVYILNVDDSLKEWSNTNLVDIASILNWMPNIAKANKSENISNINNNTLSQWVSNSNSYNAWSKNSVDYGMTKMLSNYFGIMFDKKYTFENFVVGGGNEFAYSICTAISKNPGMNYNPLFLWGNVGLGKTHLLQATANSIINRFPDKAVLYLPTTKFIDEMVDSIRKNKLSWFIKKFDSVDVLMLDDIQFLANKEKTQEVLHNLFNEFVSKNKQIIISSDRPPKQLPTIEDRLRSRFGQWMITDVSMPDAETRIAIITNYLKVRNIVLNQSISIENEIIEIIANSMDDNIREIEWMLNSLIAKKDLINRDLVISDIYTAIKSLWYKISDDNKSEYSDDIYIDKQNNLTISETEKPSYNKFDRIVEQMCNDNDISIEEIKSDSKKKHISQLRQHLMYIAKNDFGWTLERIGEYFGGKHYTSVIYAVGEHSKRTKG